MSRSRGMVGGGGEDQHILGRDCTKIGTGTCSQIGVPAMTGRVVAFRSWKQNNTIRKEAL